MAKRLMAVALACATAIPVVAFAQSDVTLYGTIDTGIRNQSKVRTATGDGSLASMTSGLRVGDRWGIRGSEDLGEGLKAHVNLEGAYSSDTGAGQTAGSSAGLFGRTAEVGLSSGKSDFYMGHAFTLNFKESAIYVPMSYQFALLVPELAYTAGVRSSNMIWGETTFDGFHIRADYALGEQVGNSAGGRRIGIGGDYGLGGLKVAGAYSTMNNASNTGSRKDSTIGARYEVGQFTLRAGWSQRSYDAAYPSSVDKSRLLALGVEYAFSPLVTGRLGLYDEKDTGFAPAADGKRKDAIAVVDYYLSKRTIAYAEVDHHTLDGALATSGVSLQHALSNDGATGLGVGLFHTF